jgi:hypothetical protein
MAKTVSSRGVACDTDIEVDRAGDDGEPQEVLVLAEEADSARRGDTKATAHQFLPRKLRASGNCPAAVKTK